MKAFLMPLLGADPVNQAYHFLVGNRALLPQGVWAMLAAGFGEETVFRGYAFERLGKLLTRIERARKSSNRTVHFWTGPLRFPRRRRDRTGHDRRTRVRHDLCAHRQDLHADGCSRRLQFDCTLR